MSRIEIKVPALGESIVEATVVRWTKNIHDAVTRDEVIVELETDKVTLEVAAPESGILDFIQTPKGTTVYAGGLLGTINKEPTAIPATNPITAPTSPLHGMSLSPTPSSADVTDIPLSPAARKMIGDAHLDVDKLIAASQTLRLTKDDVLSYLQVLSAEKESELVVQTPVPPDTPAASPLVSILPVSPVAGPTRTESLPPASIQLSEDRLIKRTHMSRLRQRIAERLKSAQNTAAILTTFNEIDMTAVKQLRDRYKDSFEKRHGVKLGFMSFFVKASVQALQELPIVNSRIENDEIVTCNYYDIGVAVSAPQGLVVPVLRDVDMFDLAGIERMIVEYGSKAKEGKLSIDDMSGGTFTISNGGVFGSLFSTPILNPPQSAILGMHKIQERPMAINGRIEIRPMMYVALSYDHRLIDGKEAVTFLVTIKECLENPGRFLLGL
jgi:2-oxoglutarate dehydrogenase E2 component (dihydrolipoamide succinyltransferase)